MAKTGINHLKLPIFTLIMTISKKSQAKCKDGFCLTMATMARTRHNYLTQAGSIPIFYGTLKRENGLIKLVPAFKMQNESA